MKLKKKNLTNDLIIRHNKCEIRCEIVKRKERKKIRHVLVEDKQTKKTHYQ